MIPLDVLQALENLSTQQTNEMIDSLNNQLNAVAKEYFVLSSLENPFLFDLHFYYSQGILELLTDFRKYPLKPEIKIQIDNMYKKNFQPFLPTLKEILNDLLDIWQENDPHPMLKFVTLIDTKMGEVLKNPTQSTRQLNQSIIAQDLTLGQDARDINFTIHPGRVLGIHSINEASVDALFRALTQSTGSFSGYFTNFRKSY